MANGITGVGTVITRNSAALADVISLNYVNPTVDTVETTEITDSWKTILPARINPGELQITCTYDYTSYNLLKGDIVAGTRLQFVIDTPFSTPMHAVFFAYVANIEVSETNGNEKLTYIVTFIIDGSIVISES